MKNISFCFSLSFLSVLFSNLSGQFFSAPAFFSCLFYNVFFVWYVAHCKKDGIQTCTETLFLILNWNEPLQNLTFLALLKTHVLTKWSLVRLAKFKCFLLKLLLMFVFDLLLLLKHHHLLVLRFCFFLKLSPEWSTYGPATCVQLQLTVCVGLSCGLWFLELFAATLKSWYDVTAAFLFAYFYFWIKKKPKSRQIGLLIHMVCIIYWLKPPNCSAHHFC